MSGHIKLIVRESVPKRKDLKYYPGWVWEITGEDGNKVLIMPSWKEIEKAIHDTIIHELKVDTVTNRGPDTQRYQEFIKTLAKDLQELQTKIINFSEIEEVYKNCRK